MKHLFLSAGLLACLTACQAATFEGTAYGEPLTLQRVTSIGAILDRPDDWVGERVLIEGTVTDVCDNMGCWMEIQGGRDDESIRVKVDDGVIVFPTSAAGHRARVEGTVERVERTEEEAIAAARHHAEERGLEFDDATEIGPETLYRVRGLGALIQG